jgi:hypothetical protein
VPGSDRWVRCHPIIRRLQPQGVRTKTAILSRDSSARLLRRKARPWRSSPLARHDGDRRRAYASELAFVGVRMPPCSVQRLWHTVSNISLASIASTECGCTGASETIPPATIRFASPTAVTSRLPARTWIVTSPSALCSFGIAIGCFLVQVLYSNWWLSHFQYGPIEWLWRKLTYQREVAMPTHS